MTHISPKKGYGYIYKYTSPSGKSYIGQTTYSLYHRSGINGINYKKCPSFYRAIQKYGFENFTVEILATVPIEQLDEMERHYIHIFHTYPYEYNDTPGGQENYLTSKSRAVYQYSAEDGHLIKEWPSSAAAAKEWGQVASVLENCLQGKVFTQYGYCWSYVKMDKFPIHERLVNPSPKTVYQYDFDNNLVHTYNSLSEVEKAGFNRALVRKCCRNEQGSTGGYKWKCEEILAVKKFNNTAKMIEQVDINTNEVVQVFHSISQAAKNLGKSTSLIRRVLDDDTRTAYGFKWRTAQGSTTTSS